MESKLRVSQAGREHRRGHEEQEDPDIDGWAGTDVKRGGGSCADAGAWSYAWTWDGNVAFPRRGFDGCATYADQAALPECKANPATFVPASRPESSSHGPVDYRRHFRPGQSTGAGNPGSADPFANRSAACGDRSTGVPATDA